MVQLHGPGSHISKCVIDWWHAGINPGNWASSASEHGWLLCLENGGG